MRLLEESSFFSTRCCGLCWGEFPEKKFVQDDNQNTWQSNFRAVLRLDISSKVGANAVVLTECATLPDMSDEVDIALLGLSNIKGIRIRRGKFQHPVKQTAFCFHDHCFWVFKWQLGKDAPLSKILYNLVHSLTLISLSQSHLGILKPPSLFSSYMLAELVDKRSLHKIEPLIMSKLPNELRCRIWEQVGLTAERSFVIVAGETARLADCLILPTCQEVTLSSHLHAEPIRIFGIDYIRSFFERQPEGSSGYTTAKELCYITDLYGIHAIKLLGHDWESAWIGKIPKTSGQAWYGRVQAADSTIRFTSHSLCFKPVLSSSPSTTQILWDQIAVPSLLSDPNATLFDFDRDINKRGSSASIRLFRYLSLYNKNEYIKGITVFVSGNGVSGLEAHFTNISMLTGYRNGSARYFPLSTDERIAYVWLRITSSPFAMMARPSLVIQTTHERMYSFGSFILPRHIHKNKYKWIRLKSEGHINGFYYEASSLITRLGITSGGSMQSARPLLPQYHDSNFPPIAGPDAGLFVSHAYLDGIDRIEMCQIKDRCMGVLLYYFDKPPIVLGQWDSSHSRGFIYESSKESISGICFSTKSSGGHNIVTGICVLKDGIDVINGSDGYSFKVGEHIAWWFSGFSDRIVPWEGNLRRISKNVEWRQQSSGTIIHDRA